MSESCYTDAEKRLIDRWAEYAIMNQDSSTTKHILKIFDLDEKEEKIWNELNKAFKDYSKVRKETRYDKKEGITLRRFDKLYIRFIKLRREHCKIDQILDKIYKKSDRLYAQFKVCQLLPLYKKNKKHYGKYLRYWKKEMKKV